MREPNLTPGEAGSNRWGFGARLALLGIAVNAALAIIKIVAGWLGNSYALIADGIESTLDIGGSLVIWGGLKFAARPPDATHPYGHGKAEPMAGVLVSLGVIAAAIVLAVNSIRLLLGPPHDPPEPFTLVVLVAVIIVKEGLFRYVNRAGVKAGSVAVRTDALHHRSDAITSAAAFVGISVALIGGREYASADEWAALFACGLIAFNGYRLLLPGLSEVMDTAPPPEMRNHVAAVAASVPGVVEIEKCRVRKMGLDYYVDLHVRVSGEITVRAGHNIAHEVKDAVKTADHAIADVLVHIEPVGGRHG